VAPLISQELAGYFRFYRFVASPTTNGPDGETVFFLEARKVDPRLAPCPNRVLVWVKFADSGQPVGNIRCFIADGQNQPVLELSSTDPRKNWRRNLEERLAILRRVLMRWRTCPNCGEAMVLTVPPDRPDHSYYKCVQSGCEGGIGLGDGLRRELLRQRASVPPEAPTTGKIAELEFAPSMF